VAGLVAPSIRARTASSIALLGACCVVAGCGGRSVETIDVAPGGTTRAGAGGAAQAGAASSSAGAAMSGSTGFAAGGGASGGNGGAAGSAPARGGASASGAGCVTADECPAPTGRCAYATCESGVCALANVAAGALALRDLPADCFDTVCDGNGGTMKAVDPSNVPSSANSCSRAACTDGGAVESTPVLAGASCSGAAGAQLCDGAGQCVACLGDADCETGATCTQHVCTSASCSDGFKDHDETDIDCGGSCAPCALTKDCARDADCASGACDAVLPHRCLANQCADHHENGSETDVDCGGSVCQPCTDGRNCKVDPDCVAGYCDLGRGSFCESAQCLNGVLDGTETDLDCGGGICDGCALGQKCELFLDCASLACDGISRTCVADHCTDHNWDGDETYIDCGGSCGPCSFGQRCLTSSDCPLGLACAPGNPHVCQ
jgi:hypothetical protein